MRDGVVRVHLRRHQLLILAASLTAAVLVLLAIHVFELRAAGADVVRLEAQDAQEQRKLESMERQTQALQKQNTESERKIEWIRRALGTQKLSSTGSAAATSGTPPSASLRSLAMRLARLQRAAAETREQATRLSRLAARVINLRRLASIVRERTIAAIPSLNPVNGEIAAAFGYRTNPWPEFHKGLDLAADYGTPVHASAAGIVASAGWNGDFGIKVDIDHGNGYHTWYCHLSRLRVTAGQQVSRGELIAAVGSTGESTGPHLHYQVMHDGVAIDPQPYLNGVPPKVLATLRDDSRVQ